MLNSYFPITILLFLMACPAFATESFLGENEKLVEIAACHFLESDEKYKNPELASHLIAALGNIDSTSARATLLKVLAFNPKNNSDSVARKPIHKLSAARALVAQGDKGLAQIVDFVAGAEFPDKEEFVTLNIISITLRSIDAEKADSALKHALQSVKDNERIRLRVEKCIGMIKTVPTLEMWDKNIQDSAIHK